MNNNIFIPKKIKVGFVRRDGTYTGKLAYIIYFDETGKLRKEASWNSWRDKDIEPLEFDNVPMDGFVLNKKAGGYSSGWNHRNTYVRVYDPRNYEFEITIPNLLYILENTNSIKGKGLEGSFVFGWEGKELILIPTSSPDYIELCNFNELKHNCEKFEAKNLKLGATYRNKANHSLIYMGKFYKSNQDNPETKYYFFYDLNWNQFTTIKTLNKTIIDIIDENCVDNYTDLNEKLLKDRDYSDRDQSKDQYKNYPFEKFKSKTESGRYYGFEFFIERDNKLQKLIVKENRNSYYNYYNKIKYYDVYSKNKEKDLLLEHVEILQVFNTYNPKYLVSYKSNGELIKEWK